MKVDALVHCESTNRFTRFLDIFDAPIPVNIIVRNTLLPTWPMLPPQESEWNAS